MMKNTLFSVAVAAALVTTSNAYAEPNSGANLLKDGGKLSLGLLGTEGGNGYAVGLDWQFNRYAKVALNVQSHLNPEQIPAEAIFNVAGIEMSEETLYPERVRPRFTDVELTTTLRYPFDAYLAPYVEVGVAMSSIKDMAFSDEPSDSNNTSDGTEANPGEDEKDVIVSFASQSYFKYGAGLQFALADAHLLNLGMHAYTGGDDWSELGSEEDAQGVNFAYEYVSGSRLGYRFTYVSKDLSGAPRYTMAMTWAF